MGLDFSNSNAHWSYSGFHEFRKKLAASININLDEMQGFGGSKSFIDVTHPIKFLLNHSDCDGYLSPAKSMSVGKGLIEILNNWQDSYDKQQGLILAADLIKCGQNNQTMEFI